MKKKFKIAGISYRPIATQVRARSIDGEELHLVPEPQNQYDPYAIQIFSDDEIFLGYVPKYLSEELTSIIERGDEYSLTGRPDGGAEFESERLI